MAKKKKPKSSKASTETPKLANNPFAALAGLRDALPVGEEPPDESPPGSVRSAPPTPASSARRAVVRYQRKGRGGKEVTLVEKLGLDASDLETWCRDLKRALGCGGSVEDDTIVLSGDQRERLPALLESKGVARISVS